MKGKESRWPGDHTSVDIRQTEPACSVLGGSPSSPSSRSSNQILAKDHLPGDHVGGVSQGVHQGAAHPVREEGHHRVLHHRAGQGILTGASSRNILSLSPSPRCASSGPTSSPRRGTEATLSSSAPRRSRSIEKFGRKRKKSLEAVDIKDVISVFETDSYLSIPRRQVLGSTASSPPLAVSSSSSMGSSSSSQLMPGEQLSSKGEGVRGSAGAGGESSPLISVMTNGTYHHVNCVHSCRDRLTISGGEKTTGELLGGPMRVCNLLGTVRQGDQTCDVITINTQGNTHHQQYIPGERSATTRQ